MLDKKFDLSPAKKKEELTGALTYHTVKTANILIIGPTGTGKTTFINVLKNPKYSTGFADVDSQTREAMLEQNLFNYGGQFYMLQIIDTPGFGDSTDDSRTDFEQEELILKFVKKGVTSLDLVLITVRFGVRLEAAQVDTIMNVLRFLGRGMAANSALLLTHAENATVEQRRNWLRNMMDSQLSDLLKFCSKKVFFTGMAGNGTATELELTAKKIRDDQLKIIKFAADSKPIGLAGEEYDSIGNQFKLYESAAKDSLTLKKLLPDIPELARTVEKTKNNLVTLLSEKDKYISPEKSNEIIEEANAVIEGLSDFDASKIESQVQEWAKLQTAVSDYIERGTRVQESANTVREQYTYMIKQRNKTRKVIDNIILFGATKEDEKLDDDTFLDF